MIRLESNKSVLYQWDLNMRVILTNVPAGTEVHYSNASYNMDENCITVVSYSENGCVYADIPNKILQTSGVVLAYIYIQDEDKAWTEFETEILVLPRKKPADYVYTETEIKTFESLEKRIESLESTQDPDAIKNAVEDYIEQNPVEVPVQSVNGQTGEVKLNAEDVGAIAETELHTAINTALAQAKASGEFDGADGYSPTASVEQSTDGAKITITDKSGTTEAVVKNGKDGANGRDGADGQPGRDGVDGQPGKDGKDGITPTIGDNGNWYLGGTDTGKPSRGADGATGATGATGEKGTDGKSAYQYAQDGGYTGTEAEFAAKLAQEMPDELPNPNALTFTGAVTGSYDGSAPLTVNIPAGGGGSCGTDCTLATDVLASGTVVQGSEEPVDTGVTLGMLKEYKMFILSVSGVSNVNLHNWYTKLGTLSLSRVNNLRAQTIIYEFLNAEKTVLMPMIGAQGNHEVYNKFESDNHSYGVLHNAAFPQCIYNLAGLNDNTTVITYPVKSDTVDVKWAILGVVK